MEIGAKLKEARKQAGLTQEKVAENIQVSRQTISNWENEKSFPDIVSVIKLSNLYSVSLDNLLKGDQEMMDHLEKSTNIVKSNQKLIVAFLINVALLLSFVFFNGLILQNNYLIFGSSAIGIISTCILFYQIIKKL
ncbi:MULTISPECIES: helix-turn-helix domain-containing protein [Enterococcus]|uniref:helix-turn-helix domain-containing protein n=1 Tax=Enterococcus TaxID=1350 RepID=UPI0010F8A024|nr:MULTISPECIES: helix-turn-helix transcriptional regulator [Enterococcus]KAF1301889.1 transcriptional regulator [Enterococcus sp. JM9B]